MPVHFVRVGRRAFDDCVSGSRRRADDERNRADFELFEDREATFEFQTPPRLASLTFTLNAKVQNLSQNKKVDLATSTSMALNSIDKSDRVEDLFLAKIDGKYVMELLGKTGEAKADRAVQLRLRHRDFREPVQVTLRSDELGRIHLGGLAEIVEVTATGPEEHFSHLALCAATGIPTRMRSTRRPASRWSFPS